MLQSMLAVETSLNCLQNYIGLFHSKMYKSDMAFLKKDVIFFKNLEKCV